MNTNKFSNTTDYEFDAVGNLIRDIHGRQYTFNGDNKQIEVSDSQSNPVGEYKYDGLGKRIKKETATEYVVFVYDGLGKLIGEYSADGPPAAPTVNYTATDPLGSPRVLTNKQGEVVSRRDFMPFGEEIARDTNHRTATHKYGVGDNVRQKFTGYERDEETGLDFAEARYYYNNHGRFTAVDPLLASGKSANPQTFNRYTYTMNRPLILTDPTGLQSGRKPNKGQDDDVIKVGTTAPKIESVQTTYLDKTIYGDVPVGGKFQITYTYTVQADTEGEQKPEEMGSIQPAPTRRTDGSIDDSKSPRGTLADAQGLEKTEPDVVKVSPAGKQEGFRVTKTETFVVKDLPDRKYKDFTTSINYQVVVKDSVGNVARFVTTDRKNMDKAIEIRNAPRKRERGKNEEE